MSVHKLYRVSFKSHASTDPRSLDDILASVCPFPSWNNLYQTRYATGQTEEVVSSVNLYRGRFE